MQPPVLFFAVRLTVLLAILSVTAAIVPANAGSHLPDCKANPRCLLFEDLFAAKKWNELRTKWQSFTAADMQVMIDDGANVHTKNNRGGTPFHWAAINGQVAVIPALIQAEADVNAKNNIGVTPLHEAAWNGQVAVIPALIQAGADVNAKDNQGWTPLYSAAWNGQAEVIPVLIQAGADVNTTDNKGRTPLHLAVKFRYAEVIPVLVKAGGDVNTKDNQGWTLFHTAAWNGQIVVISALIQAGADVNANTNLGLTPLHVAALAGQTEIISVLVKAGAYIKATDNDGRTPLDLAKQEKHWSVVKYFESASESASANCFNIIRGKPNQIVRVNGVAMTMLVDTGASRTFLSKQQARDAGIHPTGEQKFVLADNSIVINKTGSANISMGRGMTGNFPVAIGEGSGLLGRDVLDEFACQ